MEPSIQKIVDDALIACKVNRDLDIDDATDGLAHGYGLFCNINFDLRPLREVGLVMVIYEMPNGRGAVTFKKTNSSEFPSD